MQCAQGQASRRSESKTQDSNPSDHVEHRTASLRRFIDVMFAMSQNSHFFLETIRYSCTGLVLVYQLPQNRLENRVLIEKPSVSCIFSQ